MTVAAGRSSFAKRQRDMAKKARAEAKRQKRLSRSRNSRHGVDAVDGESGAEAAAAGPVLSNTEIMAKVEALHRNYDDGLLDLDTFDEQRSLLMSQISVD